MNLVRGFFAVRLFELRKHKGSLCFSVFSHPIIRQKASDCQRPQQVIQNLGAGTKFQHSPGRFGLFLVFLLILCWGELAFHGLTNLRLSLKSPFSGWTVLERTTQDLKRDRMCCSGRSASRHTQSPHWRQTCTKIKLLDKEKMRMCLWYHSTCDYTSGNIHLLMDNLVSGFSIIRRHKYLLYDLVVESWNYIL